MVSEVNLLLTPWQQHNTRLFIASVLSIAAAVALWLTAVTPDGRDPWYAAIAIEFVIWGAIDLVFAVGGFRGVATIRSLDAAAREDAARAKNRHIARALAVNTWLNVLWLSMGAGLLAWGYLAWSASLVGHGVGVLVQAVLLTILDTIFARQLQQTLAAD